MTALFGLEPRDAGPEPVEPVIAFDDVQVEQTRLRCAGCRPGPSPVGVTSYPTGR